MHYNHKWEVFDSLKPKFASCQVYYHMADVSLTVKNKVIKAIENGYSTTRRGDSGLLYKAICKEFDLPVTCMLKSTRREWYYESSQTDQALIDMLIEISKADCAAHMLHLSTLGDKPHSWDKRTPVERFRDSLNRSDWGCEVRVYDYYFMRTNATFFELKDMAHFKEILKYPTQQSVYNEKAQEALALLRSNGSLVIEYKS